jgi:formylglycine-generating enzyme required for sulfatase activity
MKKQYLSIMSILCFTVGTAFADSEWFEWLHADGTYHKYKRIDNSMWWSDAKIEAENMGGYLATITSSDEDEFIYNNLVSGIPLDPYIGGFQPPDSPEPNGGWEWVTGEEWYYTNWATGQPDDFGDGEDTLIMFTYGQWGDYDSQQRPFIVEIPELISLLMPNGGESWVAGTKRAIQWQTNPDVNIVNVKIEFSSNDGNSWNTEMNSVPNTGSYLWTVPQVTSNLCLVRISDVNDANIFDTSNEIFTIFECNLPAQGELNGDCKIDFEDFAIMAAGWLRNGNPFAPGLGEMVFVPAGEFRYQNGDPCYVGDFLIDKFETTNEFYCKFLNEADPNAEHWDSRMGIDRFGEPNNYYYSVRDSNENYPIGYVSWYDANAFAEWRSIYEGAIYRLPTEQEWEKAAGWDPALQKLWTYGYQQDIIDCTWCNYNHCYSGSLTVGSFNGTGGKNNAKSYYGCYDMSGNHWEWTNDWSELHPGNRVIRGGTWVDIADFCKVSTSWYNTPSDHDYDVGFRLVRPLD